MSKFKPMPIPILYLQCSHISTHSFRQKLIDYSETFDQTTLHKYVPTYCNGDKYFNLYLSRYCIQAHNLIEAYIILLDYLNLKLESPHSSTDFISLERDLESDYEANFDKKGKYSSKAGIDQYSSLQLILEENHKINFDENENLIISETCFCDNNVLFIERDDTIQYNDHTIVLIMT
jgi:hypothetical protein